MDLIANLSVLDDAPPLVSQWLAFYRRQGVTRFHIFLNQHLAPDRRWEQLRRVLTAPDLTLVATYEGVEDMQERVDRFSDYSAGELRDRPFVLTADSDEFISHPARAAELMNQFDYDFIPGMLVDRFEVLGRTLPIDDGLDLASAFPLCTHFTYAALAGLISKVPVSRPGVRFRIGLHSLENQDGLRGPAWWVPVDHFKWHAGVVQRIRDRIARGYGGEHYLKQCRTFLENFVIDEDRIDLSGIPSWLRPEW